MDKERKIEEIVSKTLDISSHCQIVLKVLNLLKNEYVSLDEIDRFISRDKGFTARFLRIANSPFYGASRKVKTVKDCLALIGINTAKSLILATSSIYLYKNFGYFEQKLWEHSLAVGLCSSLLANYTNSIRPEEYLTCGILHDIGKVIINNAIPDTYQRFYRELNITEKSTAQLEEEFLGIEHTEVGAYIAERWNYPEQIKITIKYHHSSHYPENLDNTHKKICDIVKIADSICLNLGIGLSNALKKNIDIKQIEDIGIDNNMLQELQELFISRFEAQKNVLLE